MDLETATALVLRIGIVLCVLLVLIGIALIFINSGRGNYSLAQIMSVNSAVNSSNFSFGNIISGLFSLDGLSFVFMGIIVLIATPIARVILSICIFFFEKNWLYTAITLIVLINLMVAIFVVPALILH